MNNIETASNGPPQTAALGNSVIVSMLVCEELTPDGLCRAVRNMVGLCGATL